MLLIIRSIVRETLTRVPSALDISAERRHETNSTEPRGPAHSPAFLGSIDPFARRNESHHCASEARASRQNVHDTSRRFLHPQKSLWLFAHWCDPVPRGSAPVFRGRSGCLPPVRAQLFYLSLPARPGQERWPNAGPRICLRDAPLVRRQAAQHPPPFSTGSRRPRQPV